MLNTVLNAGHKAVVLGLVGRTVAGSYTIGAGLLEVRARNKAYEAAQAAAGAAAGAAASGASPSATKQ